MSDNTLIGALRRIDYTKEEFIPHSFRAMFSTIAYENMQEHGFSGKVIEALLAHKETNKVKEAYNRASYKKSMQGLIYWYGEYINNSTFAHKTKFHNYSLEKSVRLNSDIAVRILQYMQLEMDY